MKNRTSRRQCRIPSPNPPEKRKATSRLAGLLSGLGLRGFDCELYSQLSLVATLMTVGVMPVIMRVLVTMGCRRVRVFMAVMGVRHMFMGMLMLVLVFRVAAHLQSPPSLLKCPYL